MSNANPLPLAVAVVLASCHVSCGGPTKVAVTRALPTPADRSGNFPTSFLGVRDDARNVVFVLEAAGEVMAVIDDFRDELRRAIDLLSPSQNFSVIYIYFPGGRPPTTATGLVPATDGNKARAKVAAGAWPHDGLELRPALEKALHMRPDLIYLLINVADVPRADMLELKR
jgi:hypothetical protein